MSIYSEEHPPSLLLQVAIQSVPEIISEFWEYVNIVISKRLQFFLHYKIQAEIAIFKFNDFTVTVLRCEV